MASNEKLRVVQAGCGGMGGNWIRRTITSDDYDLVGLVDMRREAAEQKAEANGLDKSVVYDSLSEAIDKAKPDVVFDVTVPAAHHHVVIEALEAGCHVLGEKPMSDSLENAKAMVDAVQRTGKLYAITQTRRPDPRLISLAEFIESGAIGRICEVHSDFYIGAHFGGFREDMDDVLLADMAIHSFDQARRIMTGADPLFVQCLSFNPPHSWYRHGASAAAIFEMSDDIVYTYRGSWAAEGLNTSWQCDWRIIGSEGSVQWDGSTGFKAQRLPDAEREALIHQFDDVDVPYHEDGLAGHDYFFAEFASAVREGTPISTPAEDNIKSLVMVMAAIEASRQGKKVDVQAMLQ